MSIRELARRIGMNQSYISVVLAGERRPSTNLLEGAAEVFGVRPDYFREYREDVVLERVRADAALLERVYALVTKR